MINAFGLQRSVRVTCLSKAIAERPCAEAYTAFRVEPPIGGMAAATESAQLSAKLLGGAQQPWPDKSLSCLAAGL